MALVVKAGALGEVAALVLAAVAEQQPHAVDAEPVELVDRAQHGEPPSRIRLAAEADGFQHAVEHLAVVDLDHVLAARDAERLHRVGRHHADLGIGRRRRAAHRVGVELHELAEAARARLLVAEHPAEAIAAIGLGQRVEILGDIARERRGQVVAQRQPLLVVVLEREHALVRPVLVGQELAERVGVFDRRRLHRLEAVALIDVADGVGHAPGRRDLGRPAVGETARQARLQLVGFVGHDRATSSCQVDWSRGGSSRFEQQQGTGQNERERTMPSGPATSATIPNDLESYWLPFTPNRAFKAAPRLIARAKDMHYYTPDGRAVLDGTAGLWCTNAGHNRDPIVAAIHAQAGRARLRAGVPVRASEGVRAGEPGRGAGAGRPRPRVLLQFRIGSGRHRAEDRARLSQHPRRRLAHAPDRARARLSRRRLRRHLGRRHRRQPQVLRRAARRRRSSAGDLQSRRAGLQQGRAGMGRASRRRSRAHRRAARRLDHRRGDRRADGGLDRRAAAAERLSASGCARSATSTASC